MIMCNLLGVTEVTRSVLRGIKTIKVSATGGGTDVTVNRSGDVLEFLPIGEKSALPDANEVDVVGKLHYEGCKFSEEEMVHTEKNPLIWILAKDFIVYENVPTYIKYITVSDSAVLFCLVYGAVEVETESGAVIPLVRCCESVYASGRTTFGGKELKGYTSFTDRETNYNMGFDSVNSCIINKKVTKHGPSMSISMSVKNIKENNILLSDEGLNRERTRLKAREEKERKLHEAKLRSRADAEALSARLKAEEEEKIDGEMQLTPSSGAEMFMRTLKEIHAI